MRASKPRKPKRQKAAQTLNGEADDESGSEEEPEQVKKGSAHLTPAADVRLNNI
jgi:hypothetical protein